MLSSRPALAQYNYAEALQKSLFFEEAQRAGAVGGKTRVQWRGDSHLRDGQDMKWDLTGGWYDAGDHVKWNNSMSFYGASLAWSAKEYKAGYVSTGQMPYLLNALRWIGAYYTKCFNYTDVNDPRTYKIAIDVSYTNPPDPNPLDPNKEYGDEHSYAAAHEVMDQLFPVRPTYYADSETPQSGTVAGMAATLAAASYVLRDNGDATQADAYLAVAEKLYNFAKTYRANYQANPEKYKNSLNQRVNTTGYGAEDKGNLCWAALWLHQAQKLKNSSFGDTYVRDALTYGAEFKFDVHNSLYGAGSYKLASYIMLSELFPNGAPDGYGYPSSGWFRQLIEQNLTGAADGDRSKNSNVLAVSPGGLVILGDEWGTLRHATGQGFAAFVYADRLPAGALKDKYVAYAKLQLDYALGTNPRNRSYLLGFQPSGKTIVQKPLHATANGIWAGFEHDIPGRPEFQPVGRHTLYGAVVGGPDRFDNYFPLDGNARAEVDEAGQTEVAIDYNGGLTGSLARMAQVAAGGSVLAGFPAAAVRTGPGDQEYFVEASTQASGSSFLEVKARLNNRSRWPARTCTNMSFRYYFTVEGGATASAAIITPTSPSLETSTKATISQPTLCSNSTYYVTVTLPNEPIFPGYVWPKARRYYKEVTFRLTSSGTWDNANDWSYAGFAPLANRVPPTIATNIPVYENGTLLAGSLPTSCGSITVTAAESAVAAATALQVYPNPAHDQVKLAYAAPAAGSVTIQLVDAIGRTRSLSRTVRAGANELELDATGMIPGLYTVLVRQGQRVVHSKLSLY